MIIVMRSGATEEQITGVVDVLKTQGYQINRSDGKQHTILGAIGVGIDYDHRHLTLLGGVQSVKRISVEYKLASREFHAENSVYKIGNCEIGGNQVVLMAGPCAVESREQVMTIAGIVREAGGQVLRGGAFKPRTSPYAFQGLGEEGLRYLREAADANGLLVISEVMDRTQIELVSEYADILQVGARNMQNFTFLKDLGLAKRPILLKRGIAATISELLMSAEYVMSGGNHDVMLCLRGIRTFGTHTRNTLDIAAIPVLQSLTHLPIIVDPSHAVGIRDKIPPVTRAAVAAGCDGLLIETHHDPANALCDGPQALLPDQLYRLMAESRLIASAIGRTM